MKVLRYLEDLLFPVVFKIKGDVLDLDPNEFNDDVKHGKMLWLLSDMMIISMERFQNNEQLGNW